MEHEQTTILQQAADWYHRLREPKVSEEEILNWQKWLNHDDAHIKAFGKVEELMQLSGQIEEISWPDDHELRTDEYDGETPIVDWQQRQSERSLIRPDWREIFAFNRTPRWALVGGVLALIAVISIGIVPGLWQVNPQTDIGLDVALYETPAAEHRAVTLSDGSLITLGARSLIYVVYSEKRRRVILERGEAYFEVSKNPQRPFIVSSGNRTITAVGTAFNVTRHADRVVVTVAEGTVIVAKDTNAEPIVVPKNTTTATPTDAFPKARLVAGQQITFNDIDVTAIAAADPGVVTAWRYGRLKYLGEKLRYVIDDVNRYSEQPIRFGDQAVAELSFTGTVFQDNIDSWLASIEEAFPIDVSEQPDGTILLSSRTQ